MHLPLDEDYTRKLRIVILALHHASLEYGKKEFSFDIDDVNELLRKEVIRKLWYLDKQGVIIYKPPDPVEIYKSGHSEFVDYRVWRLVNYHTLLVEIP